MTRQWLALIALLTGLAAVGAPVNAQAAQALTCEIGASAEKAPAASAHCSGAQQLSLSFYKAARRTVVPAQQTPQLSKPATVLIEVDRAHN